MLLASVYARCDSALSLTLPKLHEAQCFRMKYHDFNDNGKPDMTTCFEIVLQKADARRGLRIVRRSIYLSYKQHVVAVY